MSKLGGVPRPRAPLHFGAKIGPPVTSGGYPAEFFNKRNLD